MDEAAVGRLFERRRSVRAFLPKPVPREVIERLLALATRAPSNHNLQPWQVHVLQGATKARLSADLRAMAAAGYGFEPELDYAPTRLAEPYRERKRNIGWRLYGAAGIARGDRAATSALHMRNFDFYGADCGLVLTVPRDHGHGAWLDAGAFLYGIMLAAPAFGLDSCSLGILAGYPAAVRASLDLEDDLAICCGLALGYADESSPISRVTSERAGVAEVCRFYD